MSRANSLTKLGVAAVLTTKTCSSRSTVEFLTSDILKIIRNLNPNKAHDHDMIRIRMLKIYDESICKALEIIFRSCLENEQFSCTWKKARCGSCLQKSSKQEPKNYRPISLLPVSDKISERLLCKRVFKFFTKKCLILSDFKTGDLCINQLQLITHQIYRSFDDGQEVRSVPRSFNNVWCKGFIFKLKQIGLSGNLLSTLIDFWKKDSDFEWSFRFMVQTEAGVLQRSILGPLTDSQQTPGTLLMMFSFFLQLII